MRVTYGSSSNAATVLVASEVKGQLSDAPQGLAVDSQGTVLTTMPDVVSTSTTPIDAPVGFNIFYDTQGTGAPTVPTLGLAAVPDIESAGITVDPQNNFVVVTTRSSLYDGGPGVVHINSSLNAFLADPFPANKIIPTAITVQAVDGTNELAYNDLFSSSSTTGTYNTAGELPLFSGQVTPAELRAPTGLTRSASPAPAARRWPVTAPARRSPSSRKASIRRSNPS